MRIVLLFGFFFLQALLVKAGAAKNYQESNSLFLNDIREGESEDRSAIPNERKRWPRGIIPYKISSKFNKKERQVIYDAFRMINTTTCIKFKPKRSRDLSYVYIVRGKKNSGCFSNVGMIGNRRQNLNVEPHSICMNKGAIAHEMLHIVGLYHEMSRPDRDDYIEVVEENMFPGAIPNFKKQPQSLTYGTKYDYLSLMHYGSHAGSKNGQPTILNNEGEEIKMGQLEKLTNGDIALVKAMYRCK